MMKALTLRQPWAWLVPLAKDVENRTWTPPDSLIGERIAIHAAKREEFPRETVTLLRAVGAMPRGAVTAVATVVGWCELDSGKIVRVGRSFRHDRYVMRRVAESRYASGPFCWLFDDRIGLPKPVPCRGYQRLWKLPSNVEGAVRRQLEAM